MIVIKIIFLVLNAMFAIMNYENKNYKSALFSSFVTGLLLDSLIHDLI